MQYARMKSESKRLRDNLLTSFRCHIDSGVLWHTNKGHGMLLNADNVDVYAYPYTHIYTNEHHSTSLRHVSWHIDIF